MFDKCLCVHMWVHVSVCGAHAHVSVYEQRLLWSLSAEYFKVRSLSWVLSLDSASLISASYSCWLQAGYHAHLVFMWVLGIQAPPIFPIVWQFLSLWSSYLTPPYLNTYFDDTITPNTWNLQLTSLCLSNRVRPSLGLFLSSIIFLQRLLHSLHVWISFVRK